MRRCGLRRRHALPLEQSARASRSPLSLPSSSFSTAPQNPPNQTESKQGKETNFQKNLTVSENRHWRRVWMRGDFMSLGIPITPNFPSPFRKDEKEP